MKKIIALILSVIMMFSMTSVSYAADATSGVEATTTTIDNYMDYLEEKLEGENFFVKLIARLVIVGVMLGFIKIEDFDAWFDNTAPDTDNDVESDKPTQDDSANADWEDGTELKLHPSQSLPYTENGVTITDIKITKEHCDKIIDGKICNYKYNIEIVGSVSKYSENYSLGVTLYLEHGAFSFAAPNMEEGTTIKNDGTFEYEGSYYTEYDSGRYVVSNAYFSTMDDFFDDFM